MRVEFVEYMAKRKQKKAYFVLKTLTFRKKANPVILMSEVLIFYMLRHVQCES